MWGRREPPTAYRMREEVSGALRLATRSGSAEVRRRSLGSGAVTVTAADDLVGPDEIERAAELLDGVINTTPTVRSTTLSTRVGRDVWIKHEELQRTGSFKIRGAFTFLSGLEPGTQVVAASAGNHAQGVALAASLLGMRATIHMPRDVSLPKLQATLAYGARVELVGETVDDCLAEARRRAEQDGAVLVPPFDDRRIIAGQATIGAEILDELPDVEAVAVAVGGGGLVAGVAAAIKAVAPWVRVVGVMAAGATSMAESLQAGHPVEVEPSTIADGIALREPGALTLAHVAALVDELVAVDDAAISRALLLAAERTKAVLEPAGAAPLAAVLEDLVPGDGPVVALAGGGNIDALLLGRLIEHGLSASGRYLRLRIVMVDAPGSLARLTAQVAEMGLNVIDVEHHRAGPRLPVGGVELVLTVETRDRDHQDEVVRQLTDVGFAVSVEP